MNNSKLLFLGVILALLLILLDSLGVFKRTRRYFQRRELARLRKHAPVYDMQRSISVIKENLPQNITKLNDKIIQNVLETRDDYIDSEDSYKIKSGPVQDTKAITNLLHNKGMSIDQKAVEAIFDAEFAYLKELGVVND